MSPLTVALLTKLFHQSKGQDDASRDHDDQVVSIQVPQTVWRKALFTLVSATFQTLTLRLSLRYAERETWKNSGKCKW